MTILLEGIWFTLVALGALFIAWLIIKICERPRSSNIHNPSQPPRKDWK